MNVCTLNNKPLTDEYIDRYKSSTHTLEQFWIETEMENTVEMATAEIKLLEDKKMHYISTFNEKNTALWMCV